MSGKPQFTRVQDAMCLALSRGGLSNRRIAELMQCDGKTVALAVRRADLEDYAEGNPALQAALAKLVKLTIAPEEYSDAATTELRALEEFSEWIRVGRAMGYFSALALVRASFNGGD